MKVQTVAAVLLSASTALAVPGNWKGDSSKGIKYWKHRKDGLSFDVPFDFTSRFSIDATPDQVVNGTTPTGGLPGAYGHYDLYLNSEFNIICWDIEITGFQGNYQSPAISATHIHQASRGASGPPRIAFPNPIATGKDDKRVSLGCQQGPFFVGVNGTDGVDNGRNFQVRSIEEAPANFFADVHSSVAVPGAVRGQLA